MRRPLLLVAATALVAGALSGTAGAQPAGPAHFTSHRHKHVCSTTPPPGTVACHAQVDVLADDVTPDATTTYTTGLTPAQLRKAYHIPTAASTATIAIVDAYASPKAQADLNVYRSRFGLGPTTLTQYTQTGAALTSTNVSHDVGWGQEEMLDLEMASAACPSCTLIYVGANTTSLVDLAAAVTTAKNKGANVISNSYGASEFSGESTYGTAYNKASAAGIAVTVSSGDNGYGVQFPAALGTVVAVGGTTLNLKANGARASETVWSGAGSGCSAYIQKPRFQHDKGCSKRTVADVSAVADPNTGVAVFDSYGSSGGADWYVFGGTSVAAPLIGGIYGAAGVPAAPAAAAAYAAAASLYDVTSGSNGVGCGPLPSLSTYYLCHGVAGYDGPTGVGTPSGPIGF